MLYVVFWFKSQASLDVCTYIHMYEYSVILMIFNLGKLLYFVPLKSGIMYALLFKIDLNKKIISSTIAQQHNYLY